MKTKLLITTIALVASSSVFAQGFNSNSTQNQSGFSGPTQGISTVKQVLDAGMFSDDMPVTLTGRIKASLGGEMYLFSDATGEVTVEIDHDKWFGQSATPTTNVQLIGEIDKNMSGVKVDVDVIKVM
ncbi:MULTISPECIES: NirD/YgiW/YdeI family stress tolerance protein [Vibrio]|uniref:NirD/YgiW/YdeI family stress tolerance protein n=1 Tax=Vibrio TaxID=662 RepID=UPI001A334467|nr:MULTISPECIES: NirD/YgiW/YdeI family stress tolerance protein [Vibrio]EGQ7854411.1 NirD/YgiW/YdeI family stress tolerance protein [Vibrio vulnificus]MCR9500924.1 NirD/YgiW/YdeI family stress tolerance protein [Vibrio vulnificus]MEC7308063.1 NirD/YgiW/YdeI family stress tolerance protein [Vibrio crassostreae]